MTQRRDEEARKIQFSGKSSYMLALPKKWVEDMRLHRGDPVMVTRQSDASLLITPKGAASLGSQGEVATNVSQKDSAGSLVRKLLSLYLVGYSIIHMRAKEDRLTSSQRDTIKEAVRKNLIGTEVIADSTDGVTIQILLSFPELSVENALRRMFLITVSMHKDALHALRELDADAAQGVIKTDDEVDRFSLYLIRQLKLAVQNDRVLREMGLSTPRDCLGYRLIVKSVERVADHASKIAEGVLTLKQRLDESTLNKIAAFSDHALRVFEESGLALLKRDYDAADKIVDRARLIVNTERELLRALEEGKTSYPLQTIRLIVEDIRRTAEYASDIAEIVLNMTVERVIVKQET